MRLDSSGAFSQGHIPGKHGIEVGGMGGMPEAVPHPPPETSQPGTGHSPCPSDDIDHEIFSEIGVN